MLPASINRQSRIVKLAVVLVLCAFFAISWHVISAPHPGHVHFTEQCQICHWVQTVVWVVASVSFGCALFLKQRVVVFSSIISPVVFFQSPSGRSPPIR